MNIPQAITNAMTVDVEDYFQVSAFEGHVARSDWDTRPCRVEANVDLILDLFQRAGIQATFFTLGWIAERYPSLLRRVVLEGHEVASHGYQHTRVTQQNVEQFRQDVVRTKGILEDVTGTHVIGYRAASYSINKTNLWALDVLRETGHAYSSSIYPVKHDLYGIPDAPRFPFHPSEDFLEIPVTTVRLFGRNFPCGGGGYFRLFPYRVSRWALRRVNQMESQPALFYFHPWELDPDQPRLENLNIKTRVRHYLNLKRARTRLEALLRDFRWDRMDRVYRPYIEGRVPGEANRSPYAVAG